MQNMEQFNLYNTYNQAEKIYQNGAKLLLNNVYQQQDKPRYHSAQRNV